MSEELRPLLAVAAGVALLCLLAAALPVRLLRPPRLADLVGYWRLELALTGFAALGVAALGWLLSR